MDPILFRIPLDNNTQIKLDRIEYSANHAPKLIKYGYTFSEYKMNFGTLTENKNYENGLYITEDVVKKEFPNTTNIVIKITEILNLFGLIKSGQNVYSGDIVIPNMKNSNTKSYDLVIQNYNDAIINLIEENSILLMLCRDLSNLLKMQNKGSSMIIQFTDMKTLPTVQLVAFLSSIYTEAYLLKPISSSELSSERFLVLIDLKDKVKVPEIVTQDFIVNLTTNDIPDTVGNVIQCFNSEIMRLAISTYDKIKKYLDQQVSEGALYQEMMEKRKEFVDILRIRMTENQSEYLDNLIKKSDDMCRRLDTDYS